MKNRFLVLASALFLTFSASPSYAGGAGTIIELAAKEGDDLVRAITKLTEKFFGAGTDEVADAVVHFKATKGLLKSLETDPRVASLLKKDLASLTEVELQTIIEVSARRFDSSQAGAYSACASKCANPKLGKWIVRGTTATEEAALRAAPPNLKTGIAKQLKGLEVNGKAVDLVGIEKIHELPQAQQAVFVSYLKVLRGEGSAAEKQIATALFNFSTVNGQTDMGHGFAELVLRNSWKNADGGVDEAGMARFAAVLEKEYKRFCDHGVCQTQEARYKAFIALFEDEARRAEAAGDMTKRQALNRLIEKPCYIFGPRAT